MAVVSADHADPDLCAEHLHSTGGLGPRIVSPEMLEQHSGAEPGDAGDPGVAMVVNAPGRTNFLTNCATVMLSFPSGPASSKSKSTPRSLPMVACSLPLRTSLSFARDTFVLFTARFVFVIMHHEATKKPPKNVSKALLQLHRQWGLLVEPLTAAGALCCGCCYRCGCCGAEDDGVVERRNVAVFVSAWSAADQIAQKNWKTWERRLNVPRKSDATPIQIWDIVGDGEMVASHQQRFGKRH